MILKCVIGLLCISYVIAFTPRGLLGGRECTWGPTHWCKNVTNARNCHAVKHCIQTVWEHQKAPEDSDDICTLCKHMISDARDQLESNETLNSIKEVFERSCKLIHVKPIVKECIKFADEYAPELVDMLASQMNPNVICTVAGLCNNAEIDKLIEDVDKKISRDKQRNDELQKDCESCLDFADLVGRKIERATADDIKLYLSEKCRSVGSLSVACSNLVDQYAEDIYNKLKKDFSPSSFCYLTSSCINGYGRKIQVKTESDVGVIHVNSDAISVAVKHLSEDQTCDLCKTLVKHLKDILISNTTEFEFKQVLRGLCKQTGKFKSECLSLSDEYYDQIYRFLVNDLDGGSVCSFAGICPRPGVYINGPVAPLLPEAPIPIDGILTGDHEEKYGKISVAKADSGVHVFFPIVHSPVKVDISFGDPMEPRFQLPIERMSVIPQLKDLNVNNREYCVFCQYFLHYIQKVISQPYGERALKNAVNEACNLMPQSINLQCKNFVEEFGDTFIAILAQEIDPSQVCPMLHICPAMNLGNKYEPLEIEGKPGCPLCLMVVEDVTEKLKDNKTEESIREALHGLCVRMPKNLRNQCDEFVQEYTDKVVDMMLADFTPQEVCTFLKLCHNQVDVELITPMKSEKPEVLTNEVPRNTIHEHPKDTEATSVCFLCEFVMDKVKNRLKSNSTEEEMRRILYNVCSYMPKTLKTDCNDFIKNYGKYILQLLEDNVNPRMVCHEMHVCKERIERTQMELVRRAVEDCALCEAAVGAIRGLLEDKDFDRNISRYVLRICYSIPYLRPDQVDRCRTLVLSYGPSIVNLLVELEVRPALICRKIELCDNSEQSKVHLVEESREEINSQPQERPHLLGSNSCTWGPSYWCESEDHARRCGTLAHCREMVWKAEKPTPKP